MKILYLTWGETPRSYGVFGSQVIGQFVETAKVYPGNKFYFISGIPIIHSGWFREGFSYFAEMKKIKKSLGKILFYWVPIYAPQNFINSSKRTFNLMHGASHILLKSRIMKIQPDIVHCRSYHAAWAALTIKKRNKLNYKIIFDARGLWPEEVAFKKRWTINDENYQFLKTIENTLVTECSATIGVSDTMVKYYKDMGAKNVRRVYLSSNPLKYGMGNKATKGNINYCYVGVLSDDTWHKPGELLLLFRHLRKLTESAKLTIVSSSPEKILRDIFSEFNGGEVVFTSYKNKRDLEIILNSQDVGILSYFHPKTELEIVLASMVLGVKTAEYFSAGLPMICNRYCGGADWIISNNKLGISYDPENIERITKESVEGLLSQSLHNKCRNFSANNFDYSVNGKNYCNIYSDLMSNTTINNEI